MVYDWIIDLSASNSRKHKELVIEKALVAGRLGSTSAEYFLYNCYLCYNPNYKYGFRTVDLTENLKHQENPWYDFWGLLESLRTGVFRNCDVARNSVKRLSQRFDSVQWNYVCSRVLCKDLQCGVNRTTFNKVLGNTEWRIPDLGEL
jgi:hypothetical protein